MVGTGHFGSPNEREEMAVESRGPFKAPHVCLDTLTAFSTSERDEREDCVQFSLIFLTLNL